MRSLGQDKLVGAELSNPGPPLTPILRLWTRLFGAEERLRWKVGGALPGKTWQSRSLLSQIRNLGLHGSRDKVVCDSKLLTTPPL
jgi:hypothetical protein